MKKLYILMLATLVVAACKKDDTPEPDKKEPVTETKSKYAQCTNTFIDETERPESITGGVVGCEVLKYFAKYTWYNDKNDIRYVQVDDSTWNHYIGESSAGPVYQIEHYNKDEQLVYSENYEGSILKSITEYEYTTGLKTESGRDYYLPKSRITKSKDPSAEDGGYIYHYTGNSLDSIVRANTLETYVRYEKKSENIRKAKVINSSVPGGIFYEEHLNEFGRVIKVDVFLAHGPQNIGYVLYNYDCK